MTLERRFVAGWVALIGVGVAAPAWAVPAGVSIDHPTPGEVLRMPSVQVRLGVPNGTNVSAELDGVPVPLQSAWGALPDGRSSYYADVYGVPYGLDTTLKVMATVGTAAPTVQEVHFTYDQPPTLKVIEPLAQTVVRAPGPVQLRGTCTDHLVPACQGMLVGVTFGANRGADTSVAGGSFETTLDLSGLNGQKVSVLLGSRDSSLFAGASLDLFVEDSAALTEVVALPGRVLGFDGRQTVYLDDLGVHRRPRDGGAEQLLLPVRPDQQWDTGEALIQDDVVLFSVLGDSVQQLFEWRGGMTTALSATNFAGWAAGVPGSPFALVHNQGGYSRRDLRTGASTAIGAGAEAIGGADIAGNGDVIFESGGNFSGPARLLRQRGDTVEELAREPEDSPPLEGESDGVNVAYLSGAGSGRQQIVILTPAGRVALGGVSSDSVDYALESGWVGFIKTDATGVRQAWRRSPEGTITRLGELAAPGADEIEALTARGEVLFRALGQRWLAKASGEIMTVGSDLGRGCFFDGQWYVRLGRSLFALAGSEPLPDGGADGATSVDAPADGLTPATDAGAPPDAAREAGTSASDGSANPTADDGGACSCALGAPARSHAASPLLALVGLLALRRRRR
jgi:hypothetical protein